eukprot:gene3833-4776_t
METNIPIHDSQTISIPIDTIFSDEQQDFNDNNANLSQHTEIELPEILNKSNSSSSLSSSSIQEESSVNNNNNNNQNNLSNSTTFSTSITEDSKSSSVSSINNNNNELSPTTTKAGENNNQNKMFNMQDVGLLDGTPRSKTWGSSIKHQMIPTSGDVNALFSVLLDNLANIASLVGILVFAFGMPAHLVTLYFVPGPALGVMIGSLALSFYAIYLDHKETDQSILYTAIPLGLDAPTTIGLPLLVVGPAFQSALAAGMDAEAATKEAWLVGCSTVFMIGLFKIVLSFLSFAQKQFHPVGKAGALAGIGLALLGLNELLTILQEPVAGWVSLWLLLMILLQRAVGTTKLGMKLPFNLSGVLVSALVGSAIYYVMAAAKISVVPMPENVASNYSLSYPHPANLFSTFVSAIKKNISIAIPYAILVNIGGLTISDAAVVVGNKYNTRAVLLIDSFTTIISSFFGSVTQTTPYIGHNVFHSKFKARSGYSIFTGLIIGLGGFFGYISFLTNILPKPAIIPIFIFIAFEICADTIHNTPGIKPHHVPAIVWCFFPALFQFVNIILSQVSPTLSNAIVDPASITAAFPGISGSIIDTIGVIIVLAHGFICTSLFWGTSLGYLLDNNLRKSALFLAITAVLTFFGIIHSVNPNGEVYVPWTTGSSLPYHWAASYLILALITFAFSFYKATPMEDSHSSLHLQNETDDHHHNHNHDFEPRSFF